MRKSRTTAILAVLALFMTAGLVSAAPAYAATKAIGQVTVTYTSPFDGPTTVITAKNNYTVSRQVGVGSSNKILAPGETLSWTTPTADQGGPSCSPLAPTIDIDIWSQNVDGTDPSSGQITVTMNCPAEPVKITKLPVSTVTGVDGLNNDTVKPGTGTGFTGVFDGWAKGTTTYTAQAGHVFVLPDGTTSTTYVEKVSEINTSVGNSGNDDNQGDDNNNQGGDSKGGQGNDNSGNKPEKPNKPKVEKPVASNVVTSNSGTSKTPSCKDRTTLSGPCTDVVVSAAAPSSVPSQVPLAVAAVAGLALVGVGKRLLG